MFLQLLELVKSEQFTIVDTSTEEFKLFLKFVSRKILHDLESSNNHPACFPVATGILEILRILSATNFYK